MKLKKCLIALLCMCTMLLSMAAPSMKVIAAQEKKVKTTKKTDITIPSAKLKSGKTYYIKVTAYTLDGDTKVYGTESTAKKVTVR